MTEPQTTQQPFTCFKCKDGNTPLYCLNCAEELTFKDEVDALQNAIFQSCGRLPGVSAAEQVKTCVEQLKIERDEAMVARDFADLACERKEARLTNLLRGFQTEINPAQLRVWLAGSGQLERIVELMKRTDKLLKEVDL